MRTLWLWVKSFGKIFFFAIVLIVACLLVWLLGNYYGLQSIVVYLLIGSLLCLWPAWVVFSWWRKKRQLLSEQTIPLSQALNEPNSPHNSRKDHALDRIHQAVTWLKTSRLSEQHVDTLYALPWFLVIGHQSAGKSALLYASELRFHLLPYQRATDQHTIKPTLSWEWFISDEAVFIDCSGAYFSDSALSNDWVETLQILQSHRQKRPVDGIIVVVDGAKVAKEDDSRLDQEMKILRSKLDDCNQKFQKRIPTYLVFTKTDKIEGFLESFKEYEGHEKQQLWGYTVPLANSTQAHIRFDSEYLALQERLSSRRLSKLSSVSTPLEQLRVFRFPLFLEKAAHQFGTVVNRLFAPHRFSEDPWLRGVFMAAAQVQRQSPLEEITEPTSETQAPQEKVYEGYFVYEFFRDVLLPDKNLLAATDPLPPPKRSKKPYLIAGAFFVILLSSIALFNSYQNNVALIQEGKTRTQHLEDVLRSGSSGNGSVSQDLGLIQAELEAIESVRDFLYTLELYEKNSPPLSYRFGLYSGTALRQSIRRTYFNAIHRRFCRLTYGQIDRDLREFTYGTPPPTESVSPPDQSSDQSSDPGLQNSAAQNLGQSPVEVLSKNYDLLKAYLMLANPSRVSGLFLAYELSPYWKQAVPPQFESLAQRQLEFFASQASDPAAPHLQSDEKLVAEARRKLLAFPATERLYKRLTTEVDARVPSVTLEKILAGRGNGWLTCSYTIPGSFTVEGYRGYIDTALLNAAIEMRRDDWVMGTSSIVTAPTVDVAALRSRYFRDYSEHWRRFIRATLVRPYQNRDEALDALNSLTGNTSPLEILIQEVNRQTDLTGASPTEGILAWFQSKLSPASTVIPNTEVEREFAAVRQFVLPTGPQALTGISQYRAALRSILDTLESIPEENFKRSLQGNLPGQDPLGLQKAEVLANRLLEPMRSESSSTVAVLLRQPFKNLRSVVYGTNYEQSLTVWRERVLPFATRLQSGYPFTDSGSAVLADLTQYLQPETGILSVYVKEYLASSLEDAGGEWRVKSDTTFKYSQELLTYLNTSRKIQAALFPPGAIQPTMNYELTLAPVSKGIVSIEMDGNRVEARGSTPQAARFTWPGQKSQSGGKITIIGNNTVPQEIPFLGEWGLFQFFSTGNPKLNGENQYFLQWKIGDQTVQAILKPSSSKNLFSEKYFSQFYAPKTIVPTPIQSPTNSTNLVPPGALPPISSPTPR